MEYPKLAIWKGEWQNGKLTQMASAPKFLI